jgi:argininosuccinate synthase
MRIVLAYSGGLDTSVAIPWLSEQYGAEIVTVTMDLGQGRELDDVRERALAVGAVRAHVLDVREAFARDFILPALQAGAIYEDRYPLATALGRPLIAQHLVRIARSKAPPPSRTAAPARATTRCGSTSPARALNPSIRRHRARPRVGHDPRRRDRVRPRPRHPRAGDHREPLLTDANLWGRSIECGVLEDPWCEPPEEIYTLTKNPAECPDHPAYLEIEFEAASRSRSTACRWRRWS